MLIGELVKDHIYKIFQYCETEDRDELFQLMDKEYSKRMFNINFPFCKKVELIIEDGEYVRFWKKDFKVRNKTLRVSSQWVIGNKDLFLDYLLSKKIINEERFLHYQKVVQKNSAPISHEILMKKEIDQNKFTRQSDILDEEIVAKRISQRESILLKFDSKIRLEAAEMSQNYELLYCLEKSIRNLVLEVMANKYGFEWWEKKVKFEIKEKVKYNQKNELNTGHTQLSENEIDYTTFGDLRQIIESNWEDFSGLLKNKFAFNRIMYTLNQLRGPLAHSNYLTEDEVIRLNLTIKDWLRLAT